MVFAGFAIVGTGVNIREYNVELECQPISYCHPLVGPHDLCSERGWDPQVMELYYWQSKAVFVS